MTDPASPARGLSERLREYQIDRRGAEARGTRCAHPPQTGRQRCRRLARRQGDLDRAGRYSSASRQLSAPVMATTNHERVGKALGLLKAGLGPLIERGAQERVPGPRANPGFEIVRRRLFEPMMGPAHFKDRDVVARAFAELYRTQQQEFPPECRDSDYEQRLKAAYPIHPEVFDRLYNDWSTLVKFQRTRGVLRLMAAVIHSLWDKDDRSPLILPANIPIDDPRVQFELTRYLSDNGCPSWRKTWMAPTRCRGVSTVTYRTWASSTLAAVWRAPSISARHLHQRPPTGGWRIVASS